MEKQGVSLKHISEQELREKGIILEEVVAGETTCIQGMDENDYLVGYARVIRKEDRYKSDQDFKAGDILVTRMTDPSDMPLFVKASAIITDEGGLTCHAAIESNRLGIACITNTQEYGGGTSKIKTGDMIYLRIDDNDEDVSRVYKEAGR